MADRVQQESLDDAATGTPQEVDAIGLLCPLPVLRARKVLAALPAGAEIVLLASDGMAVIDLPHFCAEAGHAYLGLEENDGVQRHHIRRG